MKIISIIGIIMVIAGLSIILNGLISGIGQGVVDGDCFDKHYNKIQGLTCDIKENQDYFSLGMCLAGFGIISMLIDSMMPVSGWYK